MNLSGKNILVTGGKGFLGKSIVNNLIKKRGIDPKHIFTPSSAEANLCILNDVKKVVSGMDVVIHTAALTGGVSFHKEHPGEVAFKNAMMNAMIIEESRKVGVQKLVGIGTATEYPKDAAVPLKEDDLWKGAPEESQLAYSAVKRMLLVQGQAYRQEYGFSVIHLLMATMYGPEDNWQGTYVIPSLVRTIENAKKEKRTYFEGWGTGKATRDFLFIEDAAEGVVLATEKYDSAEPLNIGSGVETPMSEVLQLIAQYLGYKGEIRWDATKPEGQLRKFLDITRARREIGFNPQINFATGLNLTLKTYLQAQQK